LRSVLWKHLLEPRARPADHSGSLVVRPRIDVASLARSARRAELLLGRAGGRRALRSDLRVEARFDPLASGRRERDRGHRNAAGLAAIYRPVRDGYGMG